MSDLFGRYQSQETRTLARIDSSKYPDTNKDFEANIRRLNGFVDYISQYLQQMQKGVDQATRDPLTNMRDMIMDFGVLLGGGGLLYGIDLGDLQYYLPAIATMFGFNSGDPFPINLFYAAENFLLGYIIPLDSFGFAINDIIQQWANALGLDPEFVAAVQDIVLAIQEVAVDVLDFYNTIADALGILGIGTDGEGLGPFGEIWHAISKLLGGFNLSDIGDLIDPVLDFYTPWLKQIAEAVRMLNQIIDIVRGFTIIPINDAIRGVQDWFSGLLGRFTNNENAFGELIDSLWGGFRQLIGFNLGIGDVGNAAADTAKTASTGLEVSEWNNAILGIRNNKSLMEGVDETEEANFKVDLVWEGTTTEPKAVVSATSTIVPVAYWRAAEAAKKGFISWFGKGFDNITSLVLDVYRADYDSNQWELIHTSPNLISFVDATWRYLVYNIDDVANRIDVVPGGEGTKATVLGIAWRVAGTGTHSIAGVELNGMPDHPTVHPKKPASLRTGAGNLSFAGTVYSNVVPWFGLGIIEGDVPPPYLAPRTASFTQVGSSIYTIPPEFRVLGTLIDIVALGGGKGGSGSLGALPGVGGWGADWATATLQYGVDIPMGTEEFEIFVGNGGGGGVGTVGGAGGNGQNTTVSIDGGAILTALGSTVPHNGPTAPFPGHLTYQGRFYAHGGLAGGAQNGHAPGGGGGGGPSWLNGMNAARGMVAITVRQS